MAGLQELQKAMLEAGFFPEKKYSQNFLIDEESLAALIASAKLTPKDRVLEIGGGTGIVTQGIADTGAHVTTVELHSNLAHFLRNKFEGVKNVEIVEGDFLQTNLANVDFNKVVASPPYAISDDIMYGLFAHGFAHASLVWQLEFAEKILAPPGSSEYHPLSVLGQYEYESMLVKKISPKAFFPVPNHFSAILSLDRKKKITPISNHLLFVAWIRTLFRFKNKTLSNAGKQLEKNPVKGVNPAAFDAAIRELEMENEKVFLLEPEDFVELFEAMQER